MSSRHHKQGKVHEIHIHNRKGENAKPVADQPCWFDLKRNDCAKCKPGGVQCGAPMEKWCQSKKSKTVSGSLLLQKY